MSAERRVGPITAAQIKKIHAMKNTLKMPEEHYRALLQRWDVESSKALTLQEAGELINFMDALQKEHLTNQPQLLGQRGKITKKQFHLMVSLWEGVSRNKDYDSLRKFVKKITKTWYLWLECMDRVEAGHVIAVLKEWKAKK